MTEGEPLIQANSVTRTYGGVPVIENVSVAVHPGVTAVIGPNGSGKSTLLRTLVGETTPIEGTVQYHGPSVPRRIGYLPQRVAFRDSFTAHETIAFYARLLGVQPDGYLDRVGLLDAGDRAVQDLSGGMRRLLGVAQATIGDPPVLVLDEPTSGLDPEMRDRIVRLAAEYASTTANTNADADSTNADADSTTVDADSTNATTSTTVDADSSDVAVVVSTHDLDLVDRYADRVLCLRRGSVAAAGPLSELYAAHDVESTAGLYRSIVSETGTGGKRPGGQLEDPTESIHVPGVSNR